MSNSRESKTDVPEKDVPIDIDSPLQPEGKLTKVTSCVTHKQVNDQEDQPVKPSSVARYIHKWLRDTKPVTPISSDTPISDSKNSKRNQELRQWKKVLYNAIYKTNQELLIINKHLEFDKNSKSDAKFRELEAKAQELRQSLNRLQEEHTKLSREKEYKVDKEYVLRYVTQFDYILTPPKLASKNSLSQSDRGEDTAVAASSRPSSPTPSLLSTLYKEADDLFEGERGPSTFEQEFAKTPTSTVQSRKPTELVGKVSAPGAYSVAVEPEERKSSVSTTTGHSEHSESLLGDDSLSAHVSTAGSILCEKVIVPVSSLALVTGKGILTGVKNSLVPYVQEHWGAAKLAYKPSTSEGEKSQSQQPVKRVLVASNQEVSPKDHRAVNEALKAKFLETAIGEYTSELVPTNVLKQHFRRAATESDASASFIAHKTPDLKPTSAKLYLRVTSTCARKRVTTNIGPDHPAVARTLAFDTSEVSFAVSDIEECANSPPIKEAGNVNVTDTSTTCPTEIVTQEGETDENSEDSFKTPPEQRSEVRRRKTPKTIVKQIPGTEEVEVTPKYVLNISSTYLRNQPVLESWANDYVNQDAALVVKETPIKPSLTSSTIQTPQIVQDINDITRNRVDRYADALYQQSRQQVVEQSLHLELEEDSILDTTVDQFQTELQQLVSSYVAAVEISDEDWKKDILEEAIVSPAKLERSNLKQLDPNVTGISIHQTPDNSSQCKETSDWTPLIPQPTGSSSGAQDQALRKLTSLTKRIEKGTLQCESQEYVEPDNNEKLTQVICIKESGSEKEPQAYLTFQTNTRSETTDIMSTVQDLENGLNATEKAAYDELTSDIGRQYTFRVRTNQNEEERFIAYHGYPKFWQFQEGMNPANNQLWVDYTEALHGEIAKTFTSLAIAKKKRTVSRQLVSRFVTRLTNLTSTEDFDEENVDKIFVTLQQCIRTSIIEYIQTAYIIEELLENSAQNTVNEIKAMIPYLKKWTGPIENANDVLLGLGFKECRIGVTLTISKESTSAAYFKHAIPAQGQSSTQQEESGASGDASSTQGQKSGINLEDLQAVLTKQQEVRDAEAAAYDRKLLTTMDQLQKMSMDQGETLTITSFKGDPTKWFSFWAEFEALVDKNPKYSTITKFKRLRNALEGAPSKMIGHLVYEEENYATAIEILKKDYADTKIVSTKLIEQILQMRFCNMRDAKQSREFSNELRTKLAYIDKYAPSELKYNPLLMGSLLSKVSQDFQMKFAEWWAMKSERYLAVDATTDLATKKINEFANWIEQCTVKLEANAKDNIGYHDMLKAVKAASGSRDTGKDKGGKKGGNTYFTQSQPDPNKARKASQQRKRKINQPNCGTPEPKSGTPHTSKPSQIGGRGKAGSGGKSSPRRPATPNRQGQKKKVAFEKPKVQNTVKLKCWICQGDHLARNCQRTQSSNAGPPIYNEEEMYTIIRKDRICPNCYVQGHAASNCNVSPQCQAPNCGKRHTTLMHNAFKHMDTANKQQRK